jgi:hypothetical protein
MVKRAVIDLAVSDCRKLTIEDIIAGEYATPAEAERALDERIRALRSKFEVILDEVIEEEAAYGETVNDLIEMYEGDDLIWDIWNYLTPKCMRG